MLQLSWFKDKRVFITGHTGFKGSWLCQMLSLAEAQVTGYALTPPTEPNLFNIAGLGSRVNSIIGDVRDLDHLKEVFKKVDPEIVIHMAAQPLVRESYKDPVGTYETNVMGTVNVLECVRLMPGVKSVLNVTTDKVYLNREWEWGYRENEELNGYDPYSNSKSCSELVTSSYINSFFRDSGIAVSTARAGNVIGGGDFAADRIIPDCIRAVIHNEDIIVRNPYSVRPYQHVLEPLAAYLMIVKEQYENPEYAGNYNIGPDDVDCISTGELVTLFCDKWNEAMNTNVFWKDLFDGGPHEARFLKLDCSKFKNVFKWAPRWNAGTAIGKIVEWSKIYLEHGDITECMDKQIAEFLEK